MIRWLNRLLLALNLVLVAAAFYFVASRGLATGSGWTPVELVTTVLAALSILITVLGIFIAVIAIWGYARLAEDARSVATRTAEEATTRAVAAEMERRFGGQEYGAAAAEGDDGNQH